MQFGIHVVEVLYLSFPSREAMYLIDIEIHHSICYETLCQINEIVISKPQIVKRGIERM